MANQTVTLGTRYEDNVTIVVEDVFNVFTEEGEDIKLRIFVEQSGEGNFKIGVAPANGQEVVVNVEGDGRTFFEFCNHDAAEALDD